MIIISTPLSILASQLILHDLQLPLIIKEGENPLIYNILNELLLEEWKGKKLLLPNFDATNTVLIFSDYGGESSDSNYYTYTFTFIDYDYLKVNYFKSINKLREQYGLNNPFKEIAFKDLKYGPISRSLDEFLYMLNSSVNGLVFTLIIEKKIKTIFGPDNSNTIKLISESFKEADFYEWKEKTQEKLLRILSILGYFINLLIPNHKNIFWMTDEDNIVANQVMTDKIGILFSNSIHQFINSKDYSKVGYAKPFKKDISNQFIDLLSISDLVAGSIEHYFSRREKVNPFTISEGANKILIWMALQGIALKKLNIEISKDGNNFIGKMMNFETKEHKENLEYINIVI